MLSVILRLKSALNSNLYGYKKTNNGSNQVNKWQILPPYSEDILNITANNASSLVIFYLIQQAAAYFKEVTYFKNEYSLLKTYLEIRRNIWFKRFIILLAIYLGEYSITVFHQKYVCILVINTEWDLCICSGIGQQWINGICIQSTWIY